MGDLTFIETQFPVAKLSAESYRERKAATGQTLPVLGKWWGRKPLVLVRAAILAALLPATADAKHDRDIFLMLMTMDPDGLWRRRNGKVPDALLLSAAPEYREQWLSANREERDELRDVIWSSLNADSRDRLEVNRRFALGRDNFEALSYSEKITHTVRPEQIGGPDQRTWCDINAHLGTSAKSLDDLVQELGERRFGRRPRVGDPFSGGGSIPFEAARLGCESYGADLNPVGSLLTWASLNLLAGTRADQALLRSSQDRIREECERTVQDWGIERSEEGWTAEVYLYCSQVMPPESAYPIPLAPSWVIDEKRRTCAVPRLRPGTPAAIDIEIIEDADERTWVEAKSAALATIAGGRVRNPFSTDESWSIETIRGADGLRRWSSEDIVPRENDVFQERLYCIRWRRPDGTKTYRQPTAFDLAIEQRVMDILLIKIKEWNREDIIPKYSIPSGQNTDQPIRERGWTHWHHLFHPRQLLLHGLYLSTAQKVSLSEKSLRVSTLLGAGRLANWDSKLSIWNKQLAKGEQTFANQALNTLYNTVARASNNVFRLTAFSISHYESRCASQVQCLDARDTTYEADLWITDPPYADAVNYHELGDFFLAWYGSQLHKLFPEWPADGRAPLAVKGDGDDFRKSMVEIYEKLAHQMPANGMQVVMFTHQNTAVWADLGMIMWAAGLRVTAAWTIATETPAGGLRQGNYVQGTVLLVLRKRLGGDDGFLDEVYPLVADEVRRQIDSMRDLDDDSDPNFGDTDYQLAAYAAALRVLTGFATIDGEDVRNELFRPEAQSGRGRRGAQAKSRFETVIERAIEIACEYLKPRGLEYQWETLTADERLYLRAVDMESRGERRNGVYQELARGFGVKDVKVMLQSERANSVRVKTATEFARRDLGGADFAGTALRRLLFAVFETARTNNPDIGRRYLFDEVPDYWERRVRMVAVLEWLAALGQQSGMAHWHPDAEAARLLAGRLRNDHG